MDISCFGVFTDIADNPLRNAEKCNFNLGRDTKLIHANDFCFYFNALRFEGITSIPIDCCCQTQFIEESWAIHQESAPGSVVCGSKGGVRLDPFGYFTTLCDMPMNATLDLKGTHARWHSCGDSRDAYDSPQQHWIAALQGRVELIDTAGVALNTMKISNGIYLSQKLGREVTGAEIARLSKSTAKKRV